MPEVDGTLSGFMWSIAQIAERDGVSKQAVSKKARRLAQSHGLTTTRDLQGRIATINVVEYDHIRGLVDDPSKARTDRRAPDKLQGLTPPSAVVGETYDEALRQKTWYEAERSRLRLEEEKRQLVRVDELTDAVVDIASSIVRIVDRLPGRADELMLAFERDGVAGLRAALKIAASRMRDDISSEMERLSSRSEAEGSTNQPAESERQ